MLPFQDKTIVITGSGTGIGQAIAMKFAENGANVVVLGRRKEPLEETSKILQQIIQKVNSNAFVKIFPGVDVSDEKSITTMFDSLKESNVNVDIVVNNAGVSGPVTCFANSPIDEFKSTVAIHLSGTFWTSTQALKVMKPGSKIITISTFFTEERPLEQRPYRFRSPYTASQGAKNRLAEAMSWELKEKGVLSIATNPGPVHSDRIYKTVYPKAASEFLRVTGFEDLSPEEVENVSKELLPLLGEKEETISEGIKNAAQNLAMAKQKNSEDDVKKLTKTLSDLLSKIKSIAEKIQKNTSKMISDEQFLSQSQVAEMVMNLSTDEISKMINGKVIPGDRVFYPVRSHITTTIPSTPQPNLGSSVFLLTIDSTEKNEIERAEHLAENIEKNGGKTVCLISKNIPAENQESLSKKFHSHIVDLTNPAELEQIFNTAKNMGTISAVVHFTGRVPDIQKLVDLSRAEWDGLVDKFVNIPAIVAQQSLNLFVPGGGKDPRLFKGKNGTVIIIGPSLPIGPKISESQRVKTEVFRGALRPFATTVNQELSDVLKSNVRMFLVLPGTITGKEPNNQKIIDALNYLTTDNAHNNSEVIFCPDETRN